MSGSKELRAALPAGYRFRPARKHLLVEGPDGELVRHADGRPLIISKGGKPNSKTKMQLLKQMERLTG